MPLQHFVTAQDRTADASRDLTRCLINAHDAIQCLSNVCAACTSPIQVWLPCRLRRRPHKQEEALLGLARNVHQVLPSPLLNLERTLLALLPPRRAICARDAPSFHLVRPSNSMCTFRATAVPSVLPPCPVPRLAPVYQVPPPRRRCTSARATGVASGLVQRRAQPAPVAPCVSRACCATPVPVPARTATPVPVPVPGRTSSSRARPPMRAPVADTTTRPQLTHCAAFCVAPSDACPAPSPLAGPDAEKRK
ncbi:hypothetical protein GGX14DRAFT_637720 [Mycena pura]|uniref:Uncharacterized protein n=1 Tax=Mycena pura TaxID=153505 RepID=A0AAD6YB08_9AGAR|nr:hypothetical protein GGX14DRAFT_637720 [Mycena pura]